MSIADDMQFIRDNGVPAVDPKLFTWCTNVYGAAAHLSMPVENPANKPIFQEDDGRVLAFSDIPLNRGMLAVMKELHERQVDDRQRMAMTMRIMHFGEVFQAAETQRFIRPGDMEGQVEISEALIEACATARLTVDDGQIAFDIPDVARIAAEIDAADAESPADEAT